MFRLTIYNDEDPTSPFEDDTLFKMHDFNGRHRNSTTPDEVFACRECGGARDEYNHPEVEQANDVSGDHADYAAEFRAENPDELHEYVGPEGFLLDYFEHGQCRWGLSGSGMRGMPDFRWDGSPGAGFLEVILRDEEKSWWNEMTDDEREASAASMMEVYTDYCNGEAYGYALEKVEVETCNLDETHEDADEIDSCWGFIGAEHLLGELRYTLEHFGATKDNTKIVDKAFGSTTYMDFWTKEKVSA